ncbi:MAG TPA: prepilin-type N-terminal cleavage/methylation domain-containing protein [Candidatus Hydrogenedentes bacterium]|nr:prepilin-type N-terminal cleavage/methylation domain-containing protein [Candidatus Hydrogenedentota bacterium]HOK89436.1 prepilin-type N-terminal cleavage/methylation domain-containing protein [Candidatus Hydrogenedentota bacterium]HOV60183.1 prepilin-type N-terminal cleavage/methylation domain-containing protein [Candidatus Hydrogenedentota bacterium]
MTLRRTGSRAGFTLAEMLVAATMLSIVMTAVYVLFHSAAGTWRLAESGFDAPRDTRFFLEQFQRECANTLVQAEYLCEGDDDSVTLFVLAEPLDVSKGEGRRLMRVEYTWNRNRGRVTREEGYVESAIPMMPVSEEDRRRAKRVKIDRGRRDVLLEGVTQFKLRYVWFPMPEVRSLMEPPPPEPPMYLERLEQYWGLPDAIEVTLRVEPPAEKGRVEERPFELTTLVPIRAPRQPRTRAMLEKVLGREEGDRR